VKIDTDGVMKVATTGAITGIARKNWTSSGGATEVELIDLDALYTITCASTTANAALGSDADITFTTTAQTVTSNTSSGVDVLIVALDPRDAVGTSGGRYLCRFLPTVVAGG
jgi:hypothetical protein